MDITAIPLFPPYKSNAYIGLLAASRFEQSNDRQKNDKSDQIHIDHFDISLFDNFVLTDNQV